MRRSLLALLGAVLTAIGVANLAGEVMHGSDIWRRHSLGIGFSVLGVICAWNGLSAQAGDGRGPRTIWHGVLLFAVLTTIAGVLWVLSPALAVLFATIALPFGLVSRVARWFGPD